MMVIWLVISNMSIIFHFIYGMSSFPLTHIFQDGYCTINQNSDIDRSVFLLGSLIQAIWIYLIWSGNGIAVWQPELTICPTPSHLPCLSFKQYNLIGFNNFEKMIHPHTHCFETMEYFLKVFLVIKQYQTWFAGRSIFYIVSMIALFKFPYL